jgi:hypothetical protein
MTYRKSAIVILGLAVLGLAGYAVGRGGPWARNRFDTSGLPGDHRRRSGDAMLAKQIDDLLARYRAGHCCSEPDPNRVFHLLRCYPQGARWSRDGSGCWSISTKGGDGPLALDVLLDSDLFVRSGGRDPLVITRSGKPFFAYSHSEQSIRTRGGQAHPNQFLMFLAELCVPVSYPVTANDQVRRAISDLVEAARGNVVPGEGQQSWTVPALAYYAGFDTEWTNKFGERVSVPVLVDALIEHADAEAHCAHTHYAQALAYVIHEARRQGYHVPGRWHNELQRLLTAAATSQADDGSWPIDWWESTHPDGAPNALGRGGSEAVNVAGHMLEWLSLFPEADSMATRAAAYLVKAANDLMDVTPEYVNDEALSHAAHGLYEFRGD